MRFFILNITKSTRMSSKLQNFETLTFPQCFTGNSESSLKLLLDSVLKLLNARIVLVLGSILK